MTSAYSFLDASVLPTEIPIFDLSGIVLLPRAYLPLFVEKKEFKTLVDHALRKDRLVGVVQKRQDHDSSENALFKAGCLGKITTFSEVESNKYLVILTGFLRFSVVKELKRRNGYRRLCVSYDSFSLDLSDEQVFHEPLPVGRENLLSLLKEYLSFNEISANWDEINAASDDRLVTSLSMVCPFEPIEKQALLESTTLTERYQIITALIEMSFLRRGLSPWLKH